MIDLRRVLTCSLSTLAGVTLLTACIDDPNDEPPIDDDGISIEETGDETGSSVPDLPDEPGDGDGDDHEQPPTCETTTAIASNVPPNVMLVLDKSRSMVNYTWDDDGMPQTDEVTRWTSLHATVDSITHQYQDGMRLGLTLFPSVEATGTYDVGQLVDQTAAVVGPDVDPGEDDLAPAGLVDPAHLREDRLGRERSLGSPRRRNDAVRAVERTAVLDLHERTRAVAARPIVGGPVELDTRQRR